MAEIQKKRKKYLIGRLWKYLSRHKLLIFLALVSMLSGNILGLFGPKLSGNAIDAMGVGAGSVDFPKVFYYVERIGGGVEITPEQAQTLRSMTGFYQKLAGKREG